MTGCAEEDLSLVAQAQLGDPAAFEQLVRKYQTRIRAFCSYMLADVELGEDAAQEVFVKAFQRLSSFRPAPSFSSWLFAIARNHSLDRLRRRQRAPIESWEELCQKQGELLRQVLSDPVNGIAVAEARSALRRLFAAIPAEQRELLLLREMYGLSYEELGAVLQCSVDVVKGRLKRLRAEISIKLRHLWPDAGIDKMRGAYEAS